MIDRGVSPFVLAAGFGNRLRPLTDVIPKPVVPLMGQPMVGHVLGRLRRDGFGRAVVNAHHLAGRLQAEVTAWRDRHCPDLSLAFSVERPEILGTGGGLVAARPLLEGATAAVINGDILCDFDLPALVEEHRRSGAAATLLLAEHPDVERFGAVVVDETGAVLDLASLASRRAGAAGGAGGEAVERGVFAGVHLVEEDVFDFLPAGGVACIVRQGYVPMMKAGLDVRAIIHRGTWNDLGTTERYLQTHADLLDRGFPAGGAAALVDSAGLDYGLDAASVEYGDPAKVTVARGAVLRPPLALGAGCVVEPGATVGPHCVLGEGVRVGRGALLERVVAWPGVQIEAGAQIRDAVCFRDGGEDRVAR